MIHDADIIVLYVVFGLLCDKYSNRSDELTILSCHWLSVLVYIAQLKMYYANICSTELYCL